MPDDCSICLEPLSQPIAKMINCGHEFHDKCFLEHCRSNVNATCPLCRAVIATDCRNILQDINVHQPVIVDRDLYIHDRNIPLATNPWGRARGVRQLSLMNNNQLLRLSRTNLLTDPETIVFRQAVQLAGGGQNNLEAVERSRSERTRLQSLSYTELRRLTADRFHRGNMRMVTTYRLPATINEHRGTMIDSLSPEVVRSVRGPYFDDIRNALRQMGY